MFFSFLTYICITPVYIYIGMQNYEHIMTIFLFHITILTFGTSIILEILNNYRYNKKIQHLIAYMSYR